MGKTVGKGRRVVLAVIVTLCAAGGAALWAQTSPRPTVDASMTTLVAEIRTLREAVERSTLVAAQSQLLLGRLQLQEGRLATLGRQAQDARDALIEAERVQHEVEIRLKRASAAVEATHPDLRKEVAEHVEVLKDELRQAQTKAQQQRNREAAAASALAEEQTRWVDFNTRLEALERTIAAAASAAASRVR